MTSGMHLFCTYCDQGYVARMLCLHGSLLAQGETFRIYVLCFDDATEAVITGLADPTLVGIPLRDLLAYDADYAATRSQRTKVEFYFTATPVLVRYCMGLDSEAARMTYLDSDLFFFGPSSAVFAEQGEASVGIVPHRFPSRLARLLNCGKFNVAWVSFRRDKDGIACLDWWRERCLEWCHDRVEEGRFADQGYLDEFPEKFEGVAILDHPGINAAPWNIGELAITADDGRVSLNGRTLLFYHFQGVRELISGWFEPGLKPYDNRLDPAIRDLIYLPYLRKLADAQRFLSTEHSLMPQLGFRRLPTGASLKERWGRVAARWLMPYYRRCRGQLIHCEATSIEAASSSRSKQ